MAAVGDDRRVIVCNYTEATSIVSEGAKAYVVPLYLGGNLPERVMVLARSRGGRWVEKWENMRRLGSFRLKTLPPEHPRYADQRLAIEATEEMLARLTRAQGQIAR